MDLAALPKTLGDFLDSIIPSLTQVGLLVVIVTFMVGRKRVADAARSVLERVQRLDELATGAFFTESGLLKLVPIGLLVVGLLSAIVVDRTVSYVGSAIPGRLVSSEPDTLLTTVPADDVAKLWALFPAAPDVHTLSLVLNQQTDAAASQSATGVRPWIQHQERRDAAARAIYSLKFYVLLCVGIALWSRRLGLPRRRTGARLLMVVTVCVLIGALNVGQQMDASRQSDWAKVNYVVAAQVAGGTESGARLQDAATQQKFLLRIEEYDGDRRPFLLGW